MRISIVPTQVTNVQDRIAGNVSFQQALLLGSPIFLGFIIVLIFPPSGQFVTYKIVSIVGISIVSSTLAIRIKDQIIAYWLKIFFTYYARPLYYIYDKNSTYLRNKEFVNISEIGDPAKIKPTKKIVAAQKDISAEEFENLRRFTANDRNRILFEINKKGELNVRFTEIQ